MLLPGHSCFPRAGQLSLPFPDGPAFFKYIEPDNHSEWTVVYNVRTHVFYLDRVDQMLTRSRDLRALPLERSPAAQKIG